MGQLMHALAEAFVGAGGTLGCISLDSASKLSGIVFGFAAMFLGFYTLVYRRNEVFRNSLHNKQVDELDHIRRTLHDVWVTVHQAKIMASLFKTTGMGLDDIREHMHEQWSHCKQYTLKSKELLYKISTPDYYLFPDWLDPKAFTDFYEDVNRFAPFTVSSLNDKADEEIKTYQDLLLRKIGHLDEKLRKKC